MRGKKMKGKWVRIFNTRHNGKEALIVSDELPNGKFKVLLVNGRQTSTSPDNLMLLSDKIYTLDEWKELQHIKKASTMSEKSLRSKIIRLAHSKPELRKDLLPLLTNKKAYKDPCNGTSYYGDSYDEAMEGLEECHGERIRENKVEDAFEFLQQLYDISDDFDFVDAMEDASSEYRLNSAEYEFLKWHYDNEV